MKDFLLFVDTETSDIPEDLGAKVTDTDKWPFVLQVAWRVYDKSGELIKIENHYVYEPEIHIRKSAMRIHGITLSDLKEKGTDRKKVVKKFINDLHNYKPLVVGHYIEFDSKMLQVMTHRAKLKNVLPNYRHFCTMRTTSDYTRMPNHNYPKLDELYESLFKRKIKRLHDAAVDAEATAACFFELQKRGDFTDQLMAEQSLFEKVQRRVKNKSGCGLPILILSALLLILSWLWKLN